eukprot:TRINITY_DN48011_c0_g1_i1.p2 TRINITY_DN48011_c0_g1~~TRINITY_DN48011_c0_g1_i1.p2  ORF type:complete len:347 (+),score=122.12 TRINITY_DN48011_c0_g1_i1:101-1141(+)
MLHSSFGPHFAETLCSVLAYSSCSISMVILNKLVVDRHGLFYPAAIVFFQALSAVVLVVALRLLRWVDYPAPDRQTVLRWLPLTLLFVGMLGTSLLGLRTMSVSISLLIKNLALILIAAGDWWLFGHYVDGWVVVSFGFMILGSAVGATHDPWVTPWGLWWSLANVACTTGYQLYMKLVMNESRRRLGQWGPVLYNNVLALPPLLLPTLATASGDGGWVAGLAAAPGRARLWLATMMLTGAVMTLASFWCMRMTSPTTYSVVGSLNKVPLALIGMWVFDQFPTGVGALGIVSALCGGVLYTFATARGQAKLRRLEEQLLHHDDEGSVERDEERNARAMGSGAMLRV